MITNALCNNDCDNISANATLERFNSYLGTVRKETKSGCIVRIRLDNGQTADSYVFGSFKIGDVIEVGITRAGVDGKYPRGVCERVIEYARDSNAA